MKKFFVLFVVAAFLSVGTLSGVMAQEVKKETVETKKDEAKKETTKTKKVKSLKSTESKCAGCKSRATCTKPEKE